MNTKFLATSLDKFSSDIRVQIIIAGLTLVSVVLGIFVFLPQIDVQDYLRPIFTFDFIVVIILVVDFCVRMKASKQGFRYLKKNWYEIPAMIPLYFFFVVENAPLFGPAFRSLRILRIFRLLPLLRLANLFRTAHILKASGFVYVIIISTAAIIFGALGIYVVEMSNPEANIKDYGNAIWFAFTTVTISIYGDVYPVTMEGKIIAAILIFTGLAMILSFIASFGATLIESKLKTKINLAEESRDLIKDKIDNLEKLEHGDIDTLTAMIKSLHSRLQKDSERLYSCSNCGNSSIHKAIFCSNCGVKLAINNSKR